MNGHPTGIGYGLGPWEAVTRFQQEHSEFMPDRSRERLLMTCNPRGYLKRIK